MNFSCLIFDHDGEVCFAEVITSAGLADAIQQAQETVRTNTAFATYEIWQDGERVASSDDWSDHPGPTAKPRGLLN